MKNLLLLGTVLSALITSDAATARMEEPPAVLQLLLPAPVTAAPVSAPAVRQASYQRPAGASARRQEPGPGEPAPHILLAVVIGLLLLRMRSSQHSETFTN